MEDCKLKITHKSLDGKYICVKVIPNSRIQLDNYSLLNDGALIRLETILKDELPELIVLLYDNQNMMSLYKKQNVIDGNVHCWNKM